MKVYLYRAFIKRNEAILNKLIDSDDARVVASVIAAGDEDHPDELVIMQNNENDQIISIFYGNDEYVRKTQS